MDAQMIEKAKKVKYNLQYAKSQLTVAENILKDDITVNGVILEKENFDDLFDKISDLIYSLNNTVIPVMNSQLDDDN